MSREIQWFPGHMKKALDAVRRDAPQVDLIIETADARIPAASRNPDLRRATGDKPMLLLLSKRDLADPEETERWLAYYRGQKLPALAVDARDRKSLRALPDLIEQLTWPVLQRARERGLTGRIPRVMVTGIPNTGKSSLINAMTRRRAMETSDRPGVTRGRTWVKDKDGRFEWLDTPGVLMPKLETEAQALRLAATGAIRDRILPLEEVAYALWQVLLSRYPDACMARYKLPDLGADPYTLWQEAALARGCVMSGGRPDTFRFAQLLLDEFRAGTVARMTLETAPECPETRPTGEGA